MMHQYKLALSTLQVLLFLVIASVISFFLPRNSMAQSKEFKKQVLRTIAEEPSNPNFSVIAARINTGIQVDLAYRQLDTLLQKEFGDMFWMYGCAGLYWSTQDLLRPAYKEKIRQAWKRLTPYRGDTENHFLMYYGSMYLMTQAWPDLNGSEWFTGQSSEEIRKQSEEYLKSWINEVIWYGQIEFDSPRYMYYFITPLVLLEEYTKDPWMKKRIGMLLDVFLADYAVEYLNGAYGGAHSRISDQAALDPHSGEMTTYGEYFFEGKLIHLYPDLAFAALSNYNCPEYIAEMATDRSTPYEQYERKRGRTTLRYSPLRNKEVHKITFMTSDYALGALQDGLIQPIQQQSWSLITNSTLPNNTIFGLHPYISEEELGMFFPEDPEFMLERIGSVKAGYPNENKWVGGSPYEMIVQRKNDLLAAYDIPSGVNSQHIDLFIPTRAAFVAANSDSTQFFIMLDNAYVGITCSVAPKITVEGIARRLRINSPKCAYGVIVEQRSLLTESAFRKRLASCTLARGNEEWHFATPTTTLSSTDKLAARDRNYLFLSPFLRSTYGSGQITMLQPHHKRQYVYDFTSNEVKRSELLEK